MFVFFIKFFFVTIISQMYGDSNFSPDYPKIKFCVIPDVMAAYRNSVKSYNHLIKSLGLGCTHIRGSLFIQDLDRFENGSDPDLRFLESIVEITGRLTIHGNTIRRIPLGNLKVIRGISTVKDDYTVLISHNAKNESIHLEHIDLHNLRAIMNGDVGISHNYGLDYLIHKVDWQQIILNPETQKVQLYSNHTHNKNASLNCHHSCASWNTSTNYGTQLCFGPEERDCQRRTKCVSIRGYKWCHFLNSVEEFCDRQCVGGCNGTLASDCEACHSMYKKDHCVINCAETTGSIYGHYNPKIVEDKLIYTTGGICTSQCPESLLDQDKICVFQCDFTRYYKSGNRCIECPDGMCYTKIGDQLVCDLMKLDPSYPKSGKAYTLNKSTLLKLTNCTLILGQLTIKDSSFKTGITIPMLYAHLRNVREVIGDLVIELKKNPLKNLTFLTNLKEIRGAASKNAIQSGLKVFITSLEFLGLKKLEKVYGVVHFAINSSLCYDNTIPWHEITRDFVRKRDCKKKCHPLCTNGCWGPGNTFCYKCPYLEAGEHCVAICEDVPGYYSHAVSVNKSECRKCHHLCKGNCTGPTANDCDDCLYAKENLNCVESCSRDYFSSLGTDNVSTICLPCHRTCYRGEHIRSRSTSHVCSGPNNTIKFGGCTMCDRIIRIDGISYCHIGSCPDGYFEDRIKESDQISLSIQKILCYPCPPLCGKCSRNSTKHDSCEHCKGFWYKDNCEEICIKEVLNVTREVKPGDKCPTCHPECSNGCDVENDNSKCTRCSNKKLFHDTSTKEFLCVSQCPPGRNFTDYVDNNFVCLEYRETAHYKQMKRMSYVAICALVFIILPIIFLTLVFKYKSRKSRVKNQLKEFYSNFNEPNMKEEQSSRPPNMNRLKMIPVSDLIFDSSSKPLGAGAFGKVFRGYWKVLGSDERTHLLDVVVKVIHNTSKSSTNDFLDEAQIMASVSHRHCLPLIGVCFSCEKPCLVSSFAKYGSLEKFLRNNEATVSSYSLLAWSEQIADGMAYLNMRGIIHRDLAARNVLVSQKDIVQITDFGLAKFVDHIEDGIVVQIGRVPVRWLALETLLCSSYSSASDVWAYGVTLWEIFTFAKRPYGDLDTNKLKGYLQEGNRLCQPDICTLDVYMVMVKCWLEDPHMRPLFTELMSIFEQFSHNPRRYLFIQREHSTKYSNYEAMPLKQMSLYSESTPPMAPLSTKMVDTNINETEDTEGLLNIVKQWDEDADVTMLPTRIKSKKKVLRGSSKSVSNKSNKSRKSKILQFSPFSYDGGTNASFSNETIMGPISTERSCGYDENSAHSQTMKATLQKNINSVHKENQHELRVNGREMSARDTSSFSTVLPLENVFQFVSKETSIPNCSTDIETKPTEHSPDSGNDYDFEMDDYMLPASVPSPGHYMLTPIPSMTDEPATNMNQDIEITDYGYMEPTLKST